MMAYVLILMIVTTNGVSSNVVYFNTLDDCKMAEKSLTKWEDKSKVTVNTACEYRGTVAH